jgi:hypothetical protein
MPGHERAAEPVERDVLSRAREGRVAFGVQAMDVSVGTWLIMMIPLELVFRTGRTARSAAAATGTLGRRKRVRRDLAGGVEQHLRALRS